jgi:hypothetical protein
MTLQADIDCWRHSWNSDAHLLLDIASALKLCIKNMYPNIHTKLIIAATFPVTSRECERSISRLELVKTNQKIHDGKAKTYRSLSHVSPQGY